MTRISSITPILVLLGLLSSGARAADTPKPGADQASKANLALVQGKWERKPAGNEVRLAVKEIDGTTETVTFYGQGDKILRKHRVEFRLDRKGPVNVFTYFNGEILDGENKGEKFPTNPESYIYRVDKKEFVEVSGLLAGQEEYTPSLLTWNRAAK
jgi:hypothetical protein